MDWVHRKTKGWTLWQLETAGEEDHAQSPRLTRGILAEMKGSQTRRSIETCEVSAMLNQSSPYHAQGPQRRERLLNLATLRKPPTRDGVTDSISQNLPAKEEDSTSPAAAPGEPSAE
jgi:hypothetical protein